MRSLEKMPSGISGLDKILGGGFPRGRSTLISGSAGSGKTVLSMQFLVNGVRDFGEPGLFLSFEEDVGSIITNFSSMGFQLAEMQEREEILLDHIDLYEGLVEAGDYDLEGLLIRISQSIDAIGAKRVVLDSTGLLFLNLPNKEIVRFEFKRLIDWLEERGVTSLITDEKQANGISMYGVEEYVSDCVLLLDQRLNEQVLTRRLRVVKYRGSGHASNEFPFLISEDGLTVLPVTEIRLDHEALKERVPTGHPDLDAMFGEGGFYRGSTVLYTGTTGAGKSSLAAIFIDACCSRGEKCLFFSFEESPSQIVRNMLSIGIDLGKWVEKGLLSFVSERPSYYTLEAHLIHIMHECMRFEPKTVVLDPISDFISISEVYAVKDMLARVIDFLKERGVTTLLTSLIPEGESLSSMAGITSIVDTLVVLGFSMEELKLKRQIHILKSRGMSHSNSIHNLEMTDTGIRIT